MIAANVAPVTSHPEPGKGSQRLAFPVRPNECIDELVIQVKSARTREFDWTKVSIDTLVQLFWLCGSGLISPSALRSGWREPLAGVVVGAPFCGPQPVRTGTIVNASGNAARS